MGQVHEEWNVNVGEGTGYRVLLEKNMLTINDEEPVKLTKLKSKSGMLGVAYEVPLGLQTATLYMYNGKATLAFNGVDCKTGQPYEPAKMPIWGWVFVVLYAANFFLIIGGAIGGAISAGFAVISASIAANTKMSTVVRVLICAGIYIAVTVVSLILVGIILSTASPYLYQRY